ncbi:TPA: GNAT family N-acetyltransferase [Providencia alcalifaciens]|uniref:GNAT family N-acetyltransferase n=1 Tax=Providencia sp. wls1943 TaxID=2675150 RepID=UPI0012B590DF|nr:GNAT family N-acetyltransferase [Providencia sp. wls1943]MTB67757.1 GNAT family N-acetyltransferase [Providencia sp. wls1943]
MKIDIKPYKPSDAEELHKIFYTSIHSIAASYYTKEQLDAWAPKMFKAEEWQNKMDLLMPFVAYRGNEIVGYADLQDDGYIDHFFVAQPCCGIGTALIHQIINVAQFKRINKLWAHVSLSAEMFFKINQFEVIKRQKVTVRGMVLHNAVMVRML